MQKITIYVDGYTIKTSNLADGEVEIMLIKDENVDKIPDPGNKPELE